jgi:cytosol alanyl aminopeptidase
MRRVLGYLVLASCAHGGANPTTGATTLPPGTAPTSIAPSAATPPPRDDGRLPPTVTPLRYALSLDVDPTQPRFKGKATILVSVTQPTRFVVMNGRDLNVASAIATSSGTPHTASVSARLAHGGIAPEELVLEFADPLPTGEATIELAYDAPFSESLGGLYRVKEGERWYAFTQFESTDARRAYPCFDEPGFKTSFDISIVAPHGMIAVANSPESARSSAGASTKFGFATTRPLPTYLVAFAVGDFDVRAGATSPVPIRLVATKGRAKLGELALDATAGLVAKLGDYFGIRYPYEKLDIVAVPEFAAGAMENPGLVTFRDELLLADPATATTDAKRRQAVVIAHELAHQWFGDLVTMQWWNDTWLNEGFATWMESKVVDAWRPSFGALLGRVEETEGVKDEDALQSARAVRQPVTSTSEAMEAFDGITYEKGAALLAMIERWIGEDAFQKGVRDYLHANAWKNATADDLLRALDLASSKDVTSVAKSFLDKPGLPDLSVSMSCSKGGASFAVKQSPWAPLGEESDTAAKSRSWNVPVCMHVEGVDHSVCMSVGAETTTKDILAATCPAWIFPNAGDSGYFRFALDAKGVEELAKARAKLDVAERIGFAANLWAEVRSGDLTPATYFDTLASFDSEKERHVVHLVIGSLYDASDSIVDEAARPGFERYATARLASRAADLGWMPVKGESDDRALLRRSVNFAMGEIAEDASTLETAERLAKKWLADPTSVPSDTASVAVELASRRAKGDRIDALRAKMKDTTSPQWRIIALQSLGAMGDPALLQKALDLTLTDEIRTSELFYVLGGAWSHRASRPVVYAWMKAHWEPLRAKLAGPLASSLFNFADGTCTTAARDDANAFFSSRTDGVEGSHRVLRQAIERASLCVALHDKDAAAAAAYFAKKH